MNLLRSLHQKLDNKNEPSVSVRSSVSTDARPIHEASDKANRQPQRQYAHVVIPVEIAQENSNTSSHNGKSLWSLVFWLGRANRCSC